MFQTTNQINIMLHSWNISGSLVFKSPKSPISPGSADPVDLGPLGTRRAPAVRRRTSSADGTPRRTLGLQRSPPAMGCHWDANGMPGDVGEINTCGPWSEGSELMIYIYYIYCGIPVTENTLVLIGDIYNYYIYMCVCVLNWDLCHHISSIGSPIFSFSHVTSAGLHRRLAAAGQFQGASHQGSGLACGDSSPSDKPRKPAETTKTLSISKISLSPKKQIKHHKTNKQTN